MQEANQTYSPNKSSTNINDTVTYNYTFDQNLGSPLSLFACAPVDTTKVDFVDGSGTNGAVALPMSCADAAAALANHRSLSSLSAKAPSAVMAVGWTGGNIGTATGNLSFGFKVKVKALIGNLASEVRLYDQGEYWTTLNAANVTIVPAFKVFLPTLIR